jgi:hypothetical protein
MPVSDISMERKRLAELAYTLPDSEVKRLLALLDQPKNIMLPENP